MGSTGEKAPTQGQRANLVGEYMALTPTKWSDPNEYHKAKHDQLNNLRDSLQTPDDYNNAGRELMGQTGADSYQVGNARDAFESIKGDADAKGIQLAPDVQQGFGQMRELYAAQSTARTMQASGVGGRRVPGQGKPKVKEKDSTPADTKKDNVAIMRRRKVKGIKKVRTGDFNTPPGRNPLWRGTGGETALAKARTMGTPMEDTPGGKDIEKFLNSKPDMPWPEKKQIWEEASDKWSKGVAKQIGPGGQVGVATNGAIRETSVFTTIEEPNFLAGGVSPNFQ